MIAKVKTGQRFAFERGEEDDEGGCASVTLASGKAGWMHGSRIRLFFAEKDLPATKKDPAGPSEIDEAAQEARV